MPTWLFFRPKEVISSKFLPLAVGRKSTIDSALNFTSFLSKSQVITLS
jgi:hypothetical protein